MQGRPYEMSWRIDEMGNPYSIPLTENNVVVSEDDNAKLKHEKYSYVLNEIPDSYERVRIVKTDGTQLSENLENNLKGNQFYVDYGNGVVYFSHDLFATATKITLNMSYYGRGFRKINIKRVSFEGLTSEEVDAYITQLEKLK